MLKIRLEGTKEDINDFLEDFEKDYNVLQRSGTYANRGASKYVRVYLDVDMQRKEQGYEEGRNGSGTSGTNFN